MLPKKIHILTGAIHSGKTTRLMHWASIHPDIYGILSPVIDGKRVFVNAHTKVQFEMEASGEENIIAIGRYRFDSEAFQKAITIINNAPQNKTGWLVIDEIGPLELKGQGFATILKNLLSAKTDGLQLMLVVRENLIQEIIDFFELDKFVIVFQYNS